MLNTAHGRIQFTCPTGNTGRNGEIIMMKKEKLFTTEEILHMVNAEGVEMDIEELTKLAIDEGLFEIDENGECHASQWAIDEGLLVETNDSYNNEKHYLTLVCAGKSFAKMLVNGGLADDSTFEQCFEIVLHTLTEYEDISPQAVLQAKAFLKEYIAELDKDLLRRLDERTDEDFYTEL